MKIKILHLSDLHIEENSIRDQKVVLRALMKDIDSHVKTNGKFDLIFFTGDLIAKGLYNNKNISLATEQFLVPLLTAAELGPDRLFLIPGNHDINLKERSGILARAQRTLADEDAIASYLLEATSASMKTGMEGFNSVLARMPSPHVILENNHYRAYALKIGGLTVGVAALNSAWRATGAPADGDYGQLLVGRKQMDDVVEALGSCDLKLALVHHPQSWLLLKDAQSTHRQLLVSFDGLFHGHNHEPDAQSVSGTSSSYFLSNAGCLYQSREYFNGYCVVEYDVDSKGWTIQAREYFESRQAFDVSIRFAPEGRANFTRSGSGSSIILPKVPSDEYIRTLHETFNRHLLSSVVSEVAPLNLKSIFVEPPISHLAQRQLNIEKKGESKTIFTPLKDILSTKLPIVFLGVKDIGKTTLLHHISSLTMEFASNDLPMFGSYIDLQSAGDTRASLLDAIVSFGKGVYRRSDYIELLLEGSMVVCFDNLEVKRSRQFDAVRDFCDEYKSCRFFFSMIEKVDFSLSPDSVPRPMRDAEVFFIHPFGRRQTRLLTQNWFAESSEQCAEKVDEIISMFGRLNIPRTPFLISALLWIREKQAHIAPVNQAEILDALIDGVMDKLSETKDRSGLDSNIKRHFLAALAEHLHVRSSKRISSLDLERFTVEYFTSRSLPFSTAPLLMDLKSKGILLELGDDVTFMFDAIRAFFLSGRFKENPELLDKALSEEYFLMFQEEIDYFTGRFRDQSDVLKRSLALLKKFRANSGLESDLTAFDKIRILSSGNESRRLAATGELPDRPSAEKRDELLESIDEQLTPNDTSAPGEITIRRNASSVGRYLEALRISSAVLRNSELIAEPELKTRAYSELMQSWSEILISVIQSIGSDDDYMGLHALKSILPVENAGMARYLLQMLTPNVIVALAFESLGSPKLQIVMEQHQASTVFTVERVMDAFLMAELKVGDWPSGLGKLLNDFGSSHFVAELLFTKLIQIYLFGRLSKGEQEKVRSLLGDSVVLLSSSADAESRNRAKGNFLTRIDRTKLGNQK